MDELQKIFEIKDWRDEIDTRAEKLMQELRVHYDDTNHPRKDEEIEWGTVYEGWAIQKIAALQYVVLELHAQVERLRNELAEIRRK